jgi:hypothetical protein
MTLIRPRLNDFYNLPFTQDAVDFAIPFLDEDIPLYVDPFLLWKSPSLQDNSLHTAIVNSFNHIGYIYSKGNEKEASDALILASECNEAGLGSSRKRKGHEIGKTLANDVLSIFNTIPHIGKCGFVHFEEIQLLVDNIAKDRVSDIACTFLKSFLIDYTIQSCKELNIPIEKCQQLVYNYKTNHYEEESTYLPLNPETKEPIILVPKRWLRYNTWIQYDDYFSSYLVPEIDEKAVDKNNRVAVLTFNRANYDLLQSYIGIKEKSQEDCKNDPLFKPIPIISAKKKFSALKILPTGVENKTDKEFESLSCQLLSSMLYPHLDFAAMQSRTDSGVLIRDLIFYNNRSLDFLADIYDNYNCRQIVVEMKNVKQIEREHINQLNRYLNDQFGRFGIILTRNRPPNKILRNTIDLWSGQRRSILILDDSDMAMMTDVFESKQRLPIEVIKKKYVEFTRMCPG